VRLGIAFFVFTIKRRATDVTDVFADAENLYRFMSCISHLVTRKNDESAATAIRVYCTKPTYLTVYKAKHSCHVSLHELSQLLLKFPIESCAPVTGSSSSASAASLSLLTHRTRRS